MRMQAIFLVILMAFLGTESWAKTSQAQSKASGLEVLCYTPGNVRLFRLEQDTWSSNDGTVLKAASNSLVVVRQSGSEDQLKTGERILKKDFIFSTDGVNVALEILSKGMKLKCYFNGEAASL